jgi:hypothetical protein
MGMSEKLGEGKNIYYRVSIHYRDCRVWGWKKSDVANYEGQYQFRIWPWTNVLKQIERIKRRMEWECEIVISETTSEAR